MLIVKKIWLCYTLLYDIKIYNAISTVRRKKIGIIIWNTAGSLQCDHGRLGCLAIPMIIMFVFMQKYYVEGIASSGIKG